MCSLIVSLYSHYSLYYDLTLSLYFSNTYRGSYTSTIPHVYFAKFPKSEISTGRLRYDRSLLIVRTADSPNYKSVECMTHSFLYFLMLLRFPQLCCSFLVPPQLTLSFELLLIFLHHLDKSALLADFIAILVENDRNRNNSDLHQS